MGLCQFRHRSLQGTSDLANGAWKLGPLGKKASRFEVHKSMATTSIKSSHVNQDVIGIQALNFGWHKLTCNPRATVVPSCDPSVEGIHREGAGLCWAHCGAGGILDIGIGLLHHLRDAVPNLGEFFWMGSLMDELWQTCVKKRAQ